MAFNKAADREGAPMKRRPMHRDTSLREERSFLAESQETVQNTRELLQ